MGKKAMVISWMIMIGILIIIILYFVYATRNQLIEMIKPRVSDVSAVQIYVENCIDAVSKYAAYTVGKQGGSIFLRERHFSNPFLNVNYAFDKAKTFPTIDEVKTEMEQFINSNLKNCTADFRGFKSKGIEIEEGNVSSEIIFGPKSFIVTVNYPLKISSGGKTTLIEKMQKDVPLNLGKIHSETDNFLSFFDIRYNLTYLRNRASSTYIVPFEDADLFVEASSESNLFGDSYLFLYAVS